jgi:hypothetical protein
MNRATRTAVAAFGTLAGLVGVEHGIGALLQGNQAPGAIVIKSWPATPAFDILDGEPAMTLVPNFLVSGLLAILFSLLFLVWALFFAQRRHGGLVLILLSVVMLLVGAGFGPPLLGLIIGAVATRINAPLTWWRRHLPAGLRRLLARLWPWSFGACLLAWLSMFPGTVLLSHFFGVNDPNLVYAIALCMFGLLFLTIVAGFARDIEESSSSHIAVKDDLVAHTGRSRTMGASILLWPPASSPDARY